MTAKKLSVGASLEAWCTKCKEDRGHVVESLKADGTVNRVHCGFCDGSHLFRRPKGAKAEKAGAATAPGARRKATRAEATFTEADAAKARPYAVDREFAAGDVFKHAKFGLGRVLATRSGGKMEVAFADGVRLLLCKDAGAALLRRAPRPVKVAVAVAATASEGGDEAGAEPAAAEDEEADIEGDAAAEDDAEE